MKRLFSFLISGAILGSGGKVFAQGTGTGGDGDETGTGGEGGGGSTSLINPLGDRTLTEFFLDLLQILLIFAVPIIVFFIIYAGFLYVTARGNQEQVTKATRALGYAILGGVIILGAQVILTVIEGTVSAIQQG
jgi:hypothetical protein